MNVYQLFFGMVIFVCGTLYAAIRRIYTATITEPQRQHKTPIRIKKSKGKKGKTQHKVAAPRAADPPPPQTLAPQTPHQAPSHPSKSLTAVVSTDEDFVLASPNQTPAVQVPFPSPSPALGTNPISRSIVHSDVASAQPLSSILQAPSPSLGSITNVNILPSISLAETKLVFDLIAEDRSEEAVNTRSSQPRHLPHD